jgi:hypothetical protein
MLAPPLIDVPLAKLLREASVRPMTDAEQEGQLVSLAYGNVKLVNDRVTRSLVEEALRRSRLQR